MSRTKTIIFGLVTVLAAVICVRLGIWQLARLKERRARNAIQLTRAAMPVVDAADVRALDTAETHWRRVRLRGVADYAHEALYAMRSQSGTPGVHLLTPVRPLDTASWGDTAVLVLRGFVAAPDGRTVDPEKTKEADTLEVEGLVTSFTVDPYAGAVRLPSAPRAVKLLDRDTLAGIVGRPLAPYLLLALGDTVVHDLSRPARVRPPAITEGSHLSYAVQWFGFAVIFVVGYGFFVSSSRQPRRD